METTINGELSSTRLDASVVTLLLAASKIAPLQQSVAPTPPADLLDISEEAQHLHRHRRVEKDHERPPDRFHDFLKHLLTRLTNSAVTSLEPGNSPQITPTTEQDQGDQPAQDQSILFQQTNSSGKSISLSVNGTIETADGAHLAFSLDMQVIHAQASNQTLEIQNRADGLVLNYAGAAAELTSTTFSFSLASSADTDDITGNGFGAFSLQDGLKDVRQAIKPLAKELFKAAEMPDGWGTVNRLLHVVA